MKRSINKEYCGCVYSLRDTNRWRVSRNREKVERGVSSINKQWIALKAINLINITAMLFARANDFQLQTKPNFDYHQSHWQIPLRRGVQVSNA